MSKAFTTNDEGTGAPPVARPLPPLPAGVPNYVTRRGLEQLRKEWRLLRQRWEAAQRDGASHPGDVQSLGERARALEARLASSVVAPAPAQAGQVRFGAQVRLRHEHGRESRVQLVGVDEAQPTEGLVAFTSPLARALMGASEGDEVLVRTPRGLERVLVLSLTYPDTLEPPNE
jgi:transcription elongation factor GreB